MICGIRIREQPIRTFNTFPTGISMRFLLTMRWRGPACAIMTLALAINWMGKLRGILSDEMHFKIIFITKRRGKTSCESFYSLQAVALNMSFVLTFHVCFNYFKCVSTVFQIFRIKR